MQLALQRKGGATIRCPSGQIYKFHSDRSLQHTVPAPEDASYILAAHGHEIEAVPPLAGGWVVYTGDKPEECVELLTGDVVVEQGQTTRVRLCQQLELERLKHWEPATPVQTYGEGMQRLLVTRDKGLGDMLMLGAALRELKRQCPDLEITLATSGGWMNLLRDQPGVDVLVPIGEATEYAPFDQSVDLVHYVEQADSRFERHRVDVFGEPLGLGDVPDKTVTVPLTKGEVSAARQNLNGAGSPLVGVVYRGSTNARSYPPDTIPALCEALVGRGMGVALLDHEPQPNVPLPGGAVSLCGRYEARELAATVAAMDCVVAPDTGLVHLAAAVGTPVVALASGIPAELRWSAYDNVTVIDAAGRVGCDHCHDGASCRPGGVGSESLTDWAPTCMRALPPEEIAETVAGVVA